MDIKDLDKRQLILLTLLITFIVSIATGIVTVSLMNKMPARATQTINNVIQRTIEKVTLPTTTDVKTQTTENDKAFSISEVMVNVYPAEKESSSTDTTTPVVPKDPVKSLGQGIIISDNGLILVEASILSSETDYVVALGKEFFNLKVIKKFGNGFAILGITSKTDSLNIVDETKNDITTPEDKTTNTSDLPASAITSTPVDNTQQ